MAESVGRRIANYRKRLGISSTRELADLTQGRVSESVLQNIESGRRPDLTVSQLLEIARAMRVAPVMLLAPIERPLARVDLPNASPGIAGMRVADFDAWFSGSGDRRIDDFWADGGFMTAALGAQQVLTIMRKLVPDLDELEANQRELSAPAEEIGDREGELKLEERQLRERIDARAEQLSKLGVDVTWINRPWHTESE